jgi:hypothetical protein
VYVAPADSAPLYRNNDLAVARHRIPHLDQLELSLTCHDPGAHH